MAELFQYLSVDRRLRGKLSRFPSLLEERKGMNASSSFRRFSQNFLGVSNVCPNLCIRRFVTVFRWVGPQERLTCHLACGELCPNLRVMGLRSSTEAPVIRLLTGLNLWENLVMYGKTLRCVVTVTRTQHFPIEWAADQ